MSALYQSILSITTSPAGTLAYQLILVFAIAWALQNAISLYRIERQPTTRRMVIGLGLLLLGRIILFIAGVLISTGILVDTGILPSLDRAVTAISLIIIVWLWAFPEPMRLADAASILLSLLVVTLLALSLTWTNATLAGIPFNNTPLNSVWEAFCLVITAAGMLFLLLRKPPAWEYGLSMLLILFAGHLVQLFWPIADGSLPSAVRLSQLAAYPFLLALPQRYYGSLPAGVARQQASQHADTALSLLNEWLVLENQASEHERIRQLPRFLCRAFDIEAAAVIVPDKAGQAKLFSYDRRSDILRSELSISEDKIPILWNALQRSRPLRLHASSSSPDLENLTGALFLEIGNLLAVPVVSPKKELIAGLLLFAFDPSRSWSNIDQEDAMTFATGLAATVYQSRKLDTLAAELETARSNTAELQAAGGMAAELALLASIKAENEKLSSELEYLRANASPEQVNQLEEELHDTLSELARLQQMLSEADQRALEASHQFGEDGEHMEVVISIVQELRQPMSSIMGYTDLLLGESVGILGALQRKFMERIKASTERMGALIDDLVQVTSMEGTQIELKPVDVDLNTVIDEAISHTSARMIEKNIAIRVDIPDNLPNIQSDEDALQQVVIHLLQNAGAASPADGEIVLTVQNAKDDFDTLDYVLLQVTDTGGGIPKEDLPRVFSRLYRADNPLIAGVGDTGVGLSVAKKLVEALNGRIWVDTEQGVGSTFSVLLPVSTNGKHEAETWEAP
jgi:signal transduction histidine kinase